MELIQYARFLARHFLLILAAGIITALVAGIAVANQPTKYESNASLLLARGSAPAITDYDYDQFYLLQATELYAGNIVSWMNSADVSKSIRTQAGVPEGQIRGKKSGGTIELSGTADTSAQAQSLVQAATRFVTDRTKTLSQGNNRAGFDITVTPLGDHPVKPSPLRSGLIGLVAGLLLGIIFALISQAARSTRQSLHSGKSR